MTELLQSLNDLLFALAAITLPFLVVGLIVKYGWRLIEPHEAAVRFVKAIPFAVIFGVGIYVGFLLLYSMLAWVISLISSDLSGAFFVLIDQYGFYMSVVASLAGGILAGMRDEHED